MKRPDQVVPETTDATDAGVLFREHAKYVKAFLIHQNVPESELDDALQEVFIVAHRLGGYTPGLARPSTWLCAIAVNIAANIRRYHARRTKNNYLYGKNVDHYVTYTTPFSTLSHRQALKKVSRFLRRLSKDQRYIFMRFALHGDSCAKIAAKLDIPVGTVYSRLHYVRQLIHELDDK